MYTEDDKYYKPKRSRKKVGVKKTASSYAKKKIVKNVLNIYQQKSKINDDYEDYYKDYYDDYDTNYNNSDKVNKIDTSYTDDYSDGSRFSWDSVSLQKKKYIVIIILLFIVLSILLIFLISSINIKNPPRGVTDNYVRLLYEELELRVGDTKKLELTLSETTDENYRIEWFSNNDNVVTVDDNGNMKAVNEGEAIILVAYYVNNNVYDAQCRIYVSK